MRSETETREIETWTSNTGSRVGKLGLVHLVIVLVGSQKNDINIMGKVNVKHRKQCMLENRL